MYKRARYKCRVVVLPLVQFVKCWQFFLELNSQRLHRSSEKEKESCCLEFTSSTKREINYFHIVVVQWRQWNKCTKRHDARAKLLFCQSNPFAFLPLSLTSMKSLFKLPNKCHFMKEGKSENTMVTLTKFWRVYHSQSMKRGRTAFFTAFMVLEGVTKGAGNTAGKLLGEERVLLPFAFSHALFSSLPLPPFILNARKEDQ